MSDAIEANQYTDTLTAKRPAGFGLIGRSMRDLQGWFRRRTLRTQLLLTVNLIVGTGLIAFLCVDYRRSVAVALRTKSASLSDEARAIAVAVEPLQTLGLPAVQAHINAVCTTMDRTQSPGHMIEVRIGDHALHSHPSLHGETGSDATSGDASRVFGSASAGDVEVGVSESTEGAIRETRREAGLRAGIISASGVLGTLLINLLLLRLVDAPVRNLTTYVREVGRGTFGRSFQAGSSAEISYLAGEVNAMSRELARRENDRQRQLARARQLQRHLMSAGSPRSHDRSAMAFFPADEVAGDFAEVISLADGSVLLCLADVSGHGIAAAMGAAMIKTLLLSHGSSQSTPADILTQINTRFLDASLPGDFASMIIVHIQSDRREASYASAGHETCYLRRNHGDVVALESTGTLLGVEPRADYEDARLELEPGDIFVLLSDGVSESMDDAGTLYGRAQLIQTLRESSGMTPSELAAHICHSVESFRGAGRATDDMTILAYAMESQN